MLQNLIVPVMIDLLPYVSASRNQCIAFFRHKMKMSVSKVLYVEKTLTGVSHTSLLFQLIFTSMHHPARAK